MNPRLACHAETPDLTMTAERRIIIALELYIERSITWLELQTMLSTYERNRAMLNAPKKVNA